MEMETVYDPRQVESRIYQRWLEAGAFHAEPAPGGGCFCVVIPPPNVTDRLHLGHALNNTLQDILVRQKRMAGFNTLWMPGTDHAGIATQTVVERRILAEEGKRRTDFEREDFVARIQAWKDEYQGQILSQLRAMGCSCDWQRLRFTMDEVCARAVREAFFKLFADGLIYRGKRLVNWDPATQTVLADDEVEYQTVSGHFWYLRYPLQDEVRLDGQTITHVTVATTRPETMLGDTAVAMSPADPRAKHLVGKSVRLPLVGRIIPIIADDHVVLPDPDSPDEKARYSTGFLKVTPAHDPDDWEIGQRHGLAVINVMAPDGTISDKHGWEDARGSDAERLLGMDRFEAREAIVEWFRNEGLLAEVREYTHEVGHSYRSLVPIEPYLSDQWYIAVKEPFRDRGNAEVEPEHGHSTDHADKPKDVEYIEGTDVPVNSLAGLALKPLLEGKLRFVPERYAAVYRSWLERLRDWPISRQLWWGHRIPVWQVTAFGGEAEALDEVLERLAEWYKQRRVAMIGRPAISAPLPGDQEYPTWFISVLDPSDREVIQAIREWGFQQDPDVLDTWFSSALWPISTMGWPEETELLRSFYPTDVLCTAREIITLWVSRMVMFGQYFRGEVPFADVYIHAMIQDGEGRKMSKSLGNGIDPLDIIESHGADAMRFTLAYMTTQTQDVRVPVEEITLPDGRKVNSSPKFDLGRNFCNKLWNASRFALMNLKGPPAWGEIRPAADLSDAWVLSRMNCTVHEVTESLTAYRFHEAATAIYRYMWNDFCDWYLEIAKVRLAAGDQTPKAILAHALDVLLRLLHPFLPFITEEIWSQLNALVPYRGPGESQAEDLLVTAAWPQAEAKWINEAVEQRHATLQQLIGGIREVRSRHNVPAGRRLLVTMAAEDDQREWLAGSTELIRSLAQVEEVRFAADIRPGGSDATVLAGPVQALVHDVIDRPAELARLRKRQQTLQRGVAAAEGKLGNEGFLSRAPREVVGRERERLAAMKDELQAVEKALSHLAE